MNYLILGAGKMGQVICQDLLTHGDTTQVTVADNHRPNLTQLKSRFPDSRLKLIELDVTQIDEVATHLQEADVCIGAIHYGFNVELTKAAIAARTHFCDLGGNNTIVRKQIELNAEAQKAGISIIPDCGLAPGMVAVLVAWGLDKFDWSDSVHIRVGGLPQRPEPPLNYGSFFSVEGLINEYVEPVEVLRDGQIQTIEPLTEIEELTFPEPYGKMEAFTTSGGSSTLPQTYQDRLLNLDYKTIRYPGHGRIMEAIYKIGLFSSEPIMIHGQTIAPRQLTANLLVNYLPQEPDDVVLVRVVFGGPDKHHEVTIVDEYDHEQNITAMARMTGYPAAIIAHMQASGEITKTGVFPQEAGVPPAIFLDQLAQRNVKLD